MSLIERVRQFVRDRELFSVGSRVLAAVSGGSDSVALAHILRELERACDLQLAGLVHFNHQLRAAADDDERFVAQLAESLCVPLFANRGDVAALAQRERRSLEDAARTARYGWFDEARAKSGAAVIALGHTRDDQAETFLMKLMRGASQKGLAGIYPRRGAVVRPLLDVSRGDLREWLTSLSLGWVDDETNADLENPRNRFRLRVLPELTLALGGDPRRAIARAASLLREDGEWLEAMADQAFSAAVTERSDGLVLDAGALLRLAGPIEARVVRLALQRVAGAREVAQEHVEVARAVLHGEAGSADVPGARVELSRDLLVLLERKAATK